MVVYGKLRKIIFFAPGGLWKWCYLNFPKPNQSQFSVFTKYRWFNATKWPKMPQKRIRTIPHGSGHTLGTLNHGLGPLYCCFITLFGAGSSLHPPGAPWRPPGPPGGPLTPGMSSWAIVSHPGP